MARSRMFDHEEPDSESNGSPRTTIVGGRPPATRGHAPPVPTGLQRLLRLAAEDAHFRRLLLEKRGDVALAAGVAMSNDENAILAVIPSHQLETMIRCVPPPSPRRRELLREAAAAAVVLLGGIGLAQGALGCVGERVAPDAASSRSRDGCGSTAVVTDDCASPARPDINDMMVVGGSAPDMPPPREDGEDSAVDSGMAEEDAQPRRIRNQMAPGGARPTMD